MAPSLIPALIKISVNDIFAPSSVVFVLASVSLSDSGMWLTARGNQHGHIDDI